MKAGGEPRKECRPSVQSCRDGLRKAKTILELNLEREVKGSHKGINKCMKK